MSTATARLLDELLRLKYEFGADAAARKVELLDLLARKRLPSAGALLDFHELVCFLRAFPESQGVLDAAERVAADFEGRADLRRFREDLADTGVAGTTLWFRFYWLTAIWLWRQGHADRLRIDWPEFEHAEQLNDLWHLLLPFAETPALDSVGFTAREWLDRLKGPAETDAGFLIRRFESVGVPIQVREKLYEDLDVPMGFELGGGAPARTTERWPRAPVVFQREPPPAQRPDLVAAIRAARMRVRKVGPKVGRELIDLANACMVPRHRDLLIFLYADPEDVRVVDCGNGLQFACMGAIPERRLVLESVYGFLTIMNGVPIGYVLCSAFMGSSEVAYNVFESFRGRGAAHVYAQVLAMVGELFGADSFAVDPYQLGHGNSEGQESGAWWFYYKLGFRPHDPDTVKLVRQELARMQRDPRYRSSPERVHELAASYMFLHLGEDRDDVLGELSLGNIGLHIDRYLARRFGAEREAGIATCAAEVAQLLGLRSLSALPRGDRLAWDRWAPLVLALPGVARWSPAQRRALAKVIRAKGGPAESDYVRLLDAHRPLRRALVKLAADEPEQPVKSGF